MNKDVTSKKAAHTAAVDKARTAQTSIRTKLAGCDAVPVARKTLNEDHMAPFPAFTDTSLWGPMLSEMANSIIVTAKETALKTVKTWSKLRMSAFHDKFMSDVKKRPVSDSELKRLQPSKADLEKLITQGASAIENVLLDSICVPNQPGATKYDPVLARSSDLNDVDVTEVTNAHARFERVVNGLESWKSFPNFRNFYLMTSNTSRLEAVQWINDFLLVNDTEASTLRTILEKKPGQASEVLHQLHCKIHEFDETKQVSRSVHLNQ